MQPAGDTLTTSGNVLFSLPKLPQLAKQAYRIAGLTNNLLSAAVLADAGCEVFFHHTGCEVSYKGEIILRGWQDPTTQPWQVPIHSTEEGIAMTPSSLPQSPHHKPTASTNARTQTNSSTSTMPLWAIRPLQPGARQSTKVTSEGGMA